MTDTDLQEILTECIPGDILKRNGQILYSGIDTLRPAEFYFLGFNPAKDGTNPNLCDVRLGRKNWSAYTQQCWTHKDCISEDCPRTGKARHQKNVQRIMSELGIQPQETFASNLIFVESGNTEEIKSDPLFEIYLETCWRVHKKLLKKIKPTFIVCLGNGERDSAFSLVRRKANGTQNEARYLNFKGFVGTFQLDDGINLTAKVIGVRHPSRPMSPRGLRGFIRF